MSRQLLFSFKELHTIDTKSEPSALFFQMLQQLLHAKLRNNLILRHFSGTFVALSQFLGEEGGEQEVLLAALYLQLGSAIWVGTYAILSFDLVGARLADHPVA